MARSRWRLHAKIYIGDDAATLGSSNFTNPGLRGQLEANARFVRSERVAVLHAHQYTPFFYTLASRTQTDGRYQNMLNSYTVIVHTLMHVYILADFILRQILQDLIVETFALI